jgi:hypothetical protein
MMIYSAVFLSLSAIVVSIEGSHLPYLRTTVGEIKSNEDDATTSNCNNVRDPEHCFRTTDTATGSACMWCIAGAIPSECMSPNQASLLPPDVFDCAAPGETVSTTTTTTTTESTTTTSSIPTSFRFDSVIFGTTQIYSLVQDNHSHTDHHEHEKRATLAPPQPSKSDLCDAASNSLSGYMDIKGSEYDKSGENKHLFYWFFEKRGTDTNTLLDADIPVCNYFRENVSTFLI